MHILAQSHSPLCQFILPRPTTKLHFPPPYQLNPFPNFSLKCSLSTVSAPSSVSKPLPAENSRTIMELSSIATLSTLAHDNWPLGIGVRFAVDDDGTPVLCLTDSHSRSSVGNKSSLHVQLEQCGMRTPQCTIQGSLHKPEDKKVLKWHQTMWKKRFGEEVDEEFMYAISVERVLHMEDFMEDGVWVTSSDYKSASPDPLGESAEELVNEINAKNSEDIYRFSNIYVDLDFQVSEVKMIWIDRLGFDMRLWCPQKGVFDVRIPFPREVTDIKGARSSFNGMSQLAWEVEKNYHSLDFDKVKQLKPITFNVS